jgi:hypothetical protein
MRFKKNEGRIDRALRMIIGLTLFSVGLFALKGKVLIMVFGLFLFVVGLIGFCPVYVPFGITTRKKS